MAPVLVLDLGANQLRFGLASVDEVWSEENCWADVPRGAFESFFMVWFEDDVFLWYGFS